MCYVVTIAVLSGVWQLHQGGPAVPVRRVQDLEPREPAGRHHQGAAPCFSRDRLDRDEDRGDDDDDDDDDEEEEEEDKEDDYASNEITKGRPIVTPSTRSNQMLLHLQAAIASAAEGEAGKVGQSLSTHGHAAFRPWGVFRLTFWFAGLSAL
jgi:hypothetical protein